MSTGYQQTGVKLSEIVRKCCGLSTDGKAGNLNNASSALLALQLWINELELAFSEILENLRENSSQLAKGKEGGRRATDKQHRNNMELLNFHPPATITTTTLLECIIPYFVYYLQLRDVMAAQIKEAAKLLVSAISVYDYFNVISERLLKEQDVRFRLWLCREIDRNWTEAFFASNCNYLGVRKYK